MDQKGRSTRSLFFLSDLGIVTIHAMCLLAIDNAQDLR